MAILEENGLRQEVAMSAEEVLKAIKYMVKERERIRLKSIRFRRARGIEPRNFRPKPPADESLTPIRPRGRPKKAPASPADPDAPVPPKRGRGRPRKTPIVDTPVVISDPTTEQ